MDLTSYMEETTLDLSFVVDDEMHSFDSTQQQAVNIFIPQQVYQQQPLELNAIEFSAEELEAIQEINELFESAPFLDESSFENADQNLHYLEQEQVSGETSFDDESIYMEEGQTYAEFEELDSNSLMMLVGTDEDDFSYEMEDDNESFHRVPSPTSVVSARYAQFPQP